MTPARTEFEAWARKQHNLNDQVPITWTDSGPWVQPQFGNSFVLDREWIGYQAALAGRGARVSESGIDAAVAVFEQGWPGHHDNNKSKREHVKAIVDAAVGGKG